MSASFEIHQPTGAGSGTAGVARDDIWQGRQVHLHCVDDHNEYQWTLLDIPPGSTVSITGGTTKDAYFTPDSPDSYRVQLVVDGGGSGNVSTKIIGVSKSSLGAVIRRGWRIPAFDERPGENNFAGNARGHAPAMELILTDILTNAFDAGGGGGGGIVYRPGGTTVGNIFATWTEVMAAFALSVGIATIVIDDSLVSPAIIPSGNYDLQNRAFLTGYLQSASPRADLQLASSAVLQNTGGFNFLNVSSVSETPSIVSTSGPLSFVADHAIFMQVSLVGAMIEVPGGGSHVELRGDSEFYRTYDIGGVATSGAVFLAMGAAEIQLDEFAKIDKGSFKGDVRGDITVSLSSSAASCSSIHADFEGTLTINPAPDILNTLVFQPGGTSERNIYALWSSLMTSFAVNTAGEVDIWLEEPSIPGSIIIPAGTYDMEKRVNLKGPVSRQGVIFADSCAFTNLERFSNLVLQTNVVTGSAIPVISNSIVLDNCSVQTSGIGSFIEMLQATTFRLQNNTTVDAGPGGAALYVTGTSTIYVGDGCSIGTNKISGDGTLDVYLETCTASCSLTQTSFTGDLTIHLPQPAVYEKEYIFTGGENTTLNGSSSPLIMGAVYFDPNMVVPATDGRTRLVTFKAIIETSHASHAANLDLYDINGITNGGTPIPIAASALSSVSLSPEYVTANLTTALGTVSGGILECRLWISSPDSTNVATCKMAKIEVSWGSTAVPSGGPPP